MMSPPTYQEATTSPPGEAPAAGSAASPTSNTDEDLLKRNAALMKELGMEAKAILTAPEEKLDELDTAALLEKNQAVVAQISSTGTATRAEKESLTATGRALTKRKEELDAIRNTPSTAELLRSNSELVAAVSGGTATRADKEKLRVVMQEIQSDNTALRSAQQEIDALDTKALLEQNQALVAKVRSGTATRVEQGTLERVGKKVAARTAERQQIKVGSSTAELLRKNAALVAGVSSRTATRADNEQLAIVAEELSERKADVERMKTQSITELRRKMKEVGEKMKVDTATRKDRERLHAMIEQAAVLNEENKAKERAETSQQLAKAEYTLKLRIRETEIQSMMAVIKESERTDLCFLVDTSMSMDAQIEAVKTQMIKVATQVQLTNPHLKLRVGGVFYRDPLDGAGSNTLLNFTSDIGDFVTRLNDVRAFGGGDSCEDIASGLADSFRLSWESPTKVLFHVADTPSHGRRYYDAQTTAAAAKDVIFVLDASGSMGDGSLETCKRSLINDVFPQRLGPDDNVGFIVFSDRIAARTPLAPWSTGRSLIESTLQSASAGGTTQMWCAIHEAIDMMSTNAGGMFTSTGDCLHPSGLQRSMSMGFKSSATSSLFGSLAASTPCRESAAAASAASTPRFSRDSFERVDSMSAFAPRGLSRSSVRPNSTKWIVTLTDGASSGSMRQEVEARLKETGDSGAINMLFITVNLGSEARAQIQSTCIRKHRPADKIITADGGAQAIQQAWMQVGKYINSDGSTLAWDNHPEGDHGIPEMLRRLKDGNFTYVFGRLNESTDKMIRTFNKDVGGGKFVSCITLDPKAKDVNLLSSALTSTLRSSMHRTATRSLEKSRSKSRASSLLGELPEEERTFEMDKDKPEWSTLPSLDAQIYDNDAKVDVYKLTESAKPQPLHARIVSVAVGLVNIFSSPFVAVASATMTVLRMMIGMNKDEKATLIKVAQAPFNMGNVRFARYGHVRVGKQWKECVLKDFKRKGGTAHKKEKYLESIEESTIARAFAEEFNKQKKPPKESQIGFILSPVAAVKYKKSTDPSEPVQDRFYFVEQELPGNFVKYSSNTGYWTEEELDRWMLEFALWTAEVTEGFMMVTDLQGCRTSDGYQLTDPVILCKDVGRFSSTNLGQDGIERCKKSAQALLKEKFGA